MREDEGGFSSRGRRLGYAAATITTLVILSACTDEGPLTPGAAAVTAGPRVVVPSLANPFVVGANVTDMGTIPTVDGSGRYSHSRDVNNEGQVVGIGAAANGVQHPFIWSSSLGIQDLGTLGGPVTNIQAWAVGINDAGTVVGASYLFPPPIGTRHAFIWSAGVGMQDIGTLGNSPYAESLGTDINEAGQVVGNSCCPTGNIQYHAFRWAAGSGMQDLGALGGPAMWSDATAINKAGWVVGESQLDPSTGQSHAFLWTPTNGMRDLGTLGANQSRAEAINDSGTVVGWSRTANFEYHAFVWTESGGMRDLGTLGGNESSASSINNAGMILGFARMSTQYSHPVLWTVDGAVQDLYPAIGYTYPEKINDHLQAVVGQYFLTLNSGNPNATPAGSNVAVTPLDATTGQLAPVSITFGAVAGAGTTTVTSGTVGGGSGPPPSSGFRLNSPNLYYDIQTTASFTGTAVVCVTYSDADIQNESQVRLLHRGTASSPWVDITTFRDPIANTVCGETTSFSPFAVAELRYDFAGFFAPVDNPGSGTLAVVNVAKAGSGIPVKFTLGGNFGLDVLAAGSPVSAPYTCAAGADDAVEQLVTASQSLLTYDSSGAQYVYVWKTDKTWGGTCRKITVTLKDGTVHAALFKFTK